MQREELRQSLKAAQRICDGSLQEKREIEEKLANLGKRFDDVERERDSARSEKSQSDAR